MRWISAARLEEWARTIAAEADLPAVVSDLIRASAPDINAIRFPSGEKGRVRGFDGHLQSSSHELNVPEGTSYWEFGRSEDYQGKATYEFGRVSGKLTEAERAESTFVFVSPWTWDSSKADNRIENWCHNRQSEFAWKDVRYLDGVVLEEWLSECPATAAWHARNTFKITPPTGVRSTDEFWSQFSNRFGPALTEHVILCEREQATERLLNTFMADSGTISFSADSPDEVIAFAIAAIRRAKPEIRLFLEARTLIIDSMDAGRYFVNKPGLVYMLRGDAAQSPNIFASSGPTLVPLGRQQRNGSAQLLVRPNGQAMGKAIESMGYAPNQALTLARGSGRSLTALARQIPGGSIDLPPWLPDAPSILSAILAGGWDSGNNDDKEVIRLLAGVEDYFQLEGKLRKFLRDADPPFDREGTIWKVRAPMDAFIHVGHLIGQEHLSVLRSAMSSVFSQIEATPGPDDVIGLPRGESLPHSEWLRDGLATTLLLLANWEKQAELTLGAGTGQKFADELVGSLPGLTTNARLLASLRDELPLLAEAAPRPLLAALELMLEGDGSVLLPVFEGTEGLIFPVYKYVGLLRALELLAWDPAFFDRATLILARMAAIFPGSKLVNSPMNSLQEIFVLWNSNTNASHAQRMAALDRIAHTLPGIGWGLTCSLLPTLHGVSSPTARPVLREAGALDQPAITYAELWKQQLHVTQLAITLASDQVERWNYLIPFIAQFPPEGFAIALREMEIIFSQKTGEEKLQIWEHLNKEVIKHERFSDAHWALPADRLSLMKDIANRHRPAEPFFDLKELFEELIPLEDTKIKLQRREALGKLSDEGDTDTIVRLSLEIRNAYQIIEILSQLSPSGEFLEKLWRDSFRADPASSFTLCLAGLHRATVGPEVAKEYLVARLREGTWSDHDIAQFLLSWPDEETTWFTARRLGRDVDEIYWQKKYPYWHRGSRFQLLRIVLSYLNRRRALAAMKSFLNRLGEIPNRLIFRVLDGLITELNSEPHAPDGMASYEIEQIFNELDRRSGLDDTEVARREFAFLPLLEHAKRSLRIYRILTRDADLYHEFLRLVFRGNDEPVTELDEIGKNRARQAYTLLSKFHFLPGHSEQGVDGSKLSSWIDRVRQLGVETGRAEITNQYVGRILAHSMRDDDGGWPHRAVREQIERLSSEEIERGLEVERFNMRGVHTRGVYDGGSQERGLALQYRHDAGYAADWPRTVAMLNRIADSWDNYAAHEDVEANKRKLKS